ncbi:MAG: hypothetical protein Q4G65_12595 [bacterium]|nr:hypothetical protein [bacterium]
MRAFYGQTAPDGPAGRLSGPAAAYLPTMMCWSISSFHIMIWRFFLNEWRVVRSLL